MDNIFLTEYEYNMILGIWFGIVSIWTLFIMKTKNEKKIKLTLLFLKTIAYFSLFICAISFVAGKFNTHPSYLTLGQIALSIVSFIEGVDNFFELLKVTKSNKMVESVLKKDPGGKQNLKMERYLLIITSSSIIFLFLFWIIGRLYLSYQDWDLFIKLLVGIAPFITAYCVYYMWSKNREKELKKLEYRNDYYKKIINKRIDAYECLEKISNVFEWYKLDMRNPDKDHQKWHTCFANCSKMAEVINVIGGADDKAMWISKDAYNKVREINDLLITYTDLTGKTVDYTIEVYNGEEADVIIFGLTNYDNFNKLKTELDQIIARDMLNLYDIKKFLKSKDRI